jgi:hypothetical protein
MKKRINLSSSQDSAAGYVLEKILYGNLMNLLTREEYTGCPHNGGEHNLVLRTSKEDAYAFLAICEDIIVPVCRRHMIQDCVAGFSMLKEKVAMA